jgi:hypothetical protein
LLCQIPDFVRRRNVVLTHNRPEVCGGAGEEEGDAEGVEGEEEEVESCTCEEGGEEGGGVEGHRVSIERLDLVGGG